MATIKAGTYRFNDVLTDYKTLSVYSYDFIFTTKRKRVVTSIETDEFNTNSQMMGYNGEPLRPGEYVVTIEYNGPGLGVEQFIFCQNGYVSCEPHSEAIDVIGPMVYAEADVYAYDDDSGWKDEEYKTITLVNNQEVSDDFEAWFSANAVADGVQISGVWKFKDVLTAGDFGLVNVNFTTTAYYAGFGDVGLNCDEIYHETCTTEKMASFAYQIISTTPDMSSLGVTFPMPAFVWDGEDWKLDIYGEGVKTIDFGTEQTVSTEFYNWLIANATQPMASITHNGEVIASLFPGQTATLKCAGMKMDSDVVVSVAENIGGGGEHGAEVVPLIVT